MNKLQIFIAGLGFGSFLRVNQMPELIALDRLCPVLVRCGGKRFTCAAQDCAEMIRAVELGGDYVRDVSLPVGTDERAERWQPEAPVTSLRFVPQSFTQPRPPAAIFPRHCEAHGEPEWRGDADPGL